MESGNFSELDEAQQTALSLLRLGFADEETVAEDYDTRKAELQAVAAELTRKVHRYWTQNPHLRLEIDINAVQEQLPQGRQIVRKELKLDVLDQRHFFTNSLDVRSAGFRWFVSFLAAFAEFESDKNVIVLLDEPGLGLHAKAQEDLLRFIDEQLVPKHQVITTTHSPFMIAPDKLSRVRLVEDRGPDVGTKVRDDAVAHDRDTLFPLQAALGYSIGQNLFIGPHNLLVEGVSDYIYLNVLSHHLKSLKRVGLDDRWRVLPVGGVTNVPTFVALLGQELDVTVFVDGGSRPGQRIQKLIDEGMLDSTRVLTPANAAKKKLADTEDLFSESDYLKLYRKATGQTIRLNKADETDRIIARIERKNGEYDHSLPADFLLREQADVLQDLDSVTLDAFEELFRAINKTL